MANLSRHSSVKALYAEILLPPAISIQQVARQCEKAKAQHDKTRYFF